MTTPPADSKPTVILGAGLTGLSCAYHLATPVIVLEKSFEVGGAARTYRRGDFLFDCTGHWLHLRDPQMQALVQQWMPGQLQSITRRAAVFSHGIYTPYPFQAHTHGLPSEVVAECLLGFFAAREKVARGGFAPPQTFEDYILQCLGDGIARHFMIPYNTKLWTVPPADMAHAWCGRFVPIPTAEEVVYGALTPAGTGRALGYNATFLYPREGGIGTLAHALQRALPVARVDVRCNTPATRVDWQQRTVQTAAGTVLPYARLVSTVALPDLLSMLHQVPPHVTAAASQLRATSVTYWDVGVRRPSSPEDYHWIYFPEADVPFYRAGSFSAVCPAMAPPGHSSFYVETAHPRGTPCPVRDTEVLAGLRRVGLLRPQEEPVLFERSTVDCAYTIMDHAYGEARHTVLEWLASVGIKTAGRYGAWMYDSMEGALLAGRDAAASSI